MRALVLAGLAALGSLPGCSSGDPIDEAFATERALLEVATGLRSAEHLDLYRFDPPLDVSGENLFRASRARLLRMLALDPAPEALAPIAFALALCEERLGLYRDAASHYEQAASSEALASRSREALPLVRDLAARTDALADVASVAEFLQALETRRMGLLELLDAHAADSRRWLVELEIERLDARTREWYWRHRGVVGTERALQFAREMAETHVDSRRALEHLLRLGDMYAELARSTLAQADPQSREFDAAHLRELVGAAMSIFAEVAAEDGRPEREEARAAMVSLEMLLRRAGGEA